MEIFLCTVYVIHLHELNTCKLEVSQVYKGNSSGHVSRNFQKISFAAKLVERHMLE